MLANVLSFTLLLMTSLTEMGVSPAEPLGNRTTESALKLNVLFPVFRAVLNRDLAAVRTYELLHVELTFVLLGCILARFSPSKIRFFAFETLIIGKYRQRIICWFIEIRTVRTNQFLIFFAAFEFQSLSAFALNLLVYFVVLVDCCIQRVTLW